MKLVFQITRRNCELPVLKKLRIFDVTGTCASKTDSLASEFQVSVTFGGGAKESVSIFCFDFWPKVIAAFPLF